MFGLKERNRKKKKKRAQYVNLYFGKQVFRKKKINLYFKNIYNQFLNIFSK
jgi:hypothetical protein